MGVSLVLDPYIDNDNTLGDMLRGPRASTKSGGSSWRRCRLSRA